MAERANLVRVEIKVIAFFFSWPSPSVIVDGRANGGMSVELGLNAKKRKKSDWAGLTLMACTSCKYSCRQNSTGTCSKGAALKDAVDAW